MPLKVLKDHTGRRIGRVTVLYQSTIKKVHVVRTGEEHTAPRAYVCQCDCGTQFEVLHSSISDNSPSECIQCSNKNPKKKYKDSRLYIKKHHPSYNSWYAMIRRCTSNKHVNYKNYGGRGITVCEEWYDFDVFVRDMGNRPHGMSIDRIDVNKGYSKDNCRWATIEEQSQNTRKKQEKKPI